MRSLAALVVAALAALASRPAAAAEKEPVRVGFLTVNTGALAAGGRQMEEGLTLYLKQHGNKLAGRQDRSGHPGHRRPARHHPDPHPGGGGALQRRRHHRAPGRVRGAGHQRLRQAGEGAGDLAFRRRRGPHPAQAQPLVRARGGHLGAAQPAPGRIRGEDAQVQARRHHRRRLRLRPRDHRRVPAHLRGQRRQGGAEAVVAAQRGRLRLVHRADQARRGRRSTPASPAPTACASCASTPSTA